MAKAPQPKRTLVTRAFYIVEAHCLTGIGNAYTRSEYRELYILVKEHLGPRTGIHLVSKSRRAIPKYILRRRIAFPVVFLRAIQKLPVTVEYYHENTVVEVAVRPLMLPTLLSPADQAPRSTQGLGRFEGLADKW